LQLAGHEGEKFTRSVHCSVRGLQYKLGEQSVPNNEQFCPTVFPAAKYTKSMYDEVDTPTGEGVVVLLEAKHVKFDEQLYPV
jgi:hypothetical protein